MGRNRFKHALTGRQSQDSAEMSEDPAGQQKAVLKGSSSVKRSSAGGSRPEMRDIEEILRRSAQVQEMLSSRASGLQ